MLFDSFCLSLLGRMHSFSGYRARFRSCLSVGGSERYGHCTINHRKSLLLNVYASTMGLYRCISLFVRMCIMSFPGSHELRLNVELDPQLYGGAHIHVTTWHVSYQNICLRITCCCYCILHSSCLHIILSLVDCSAPHSR